LEGSVDYKRVAGIVYGVVTAGVVTFQLALAAGAPWGAYAMGGAFPGAFPAPMRVAAVVQAVLLALLSGVILSRAGVALPSWSRTSRWAAWLAVAVAALSLVANLATPSAGERLIWAPVAFLMLSSSLVVAVSKTTPVHRTSAST
jgi:hypothetical protein